MKISVVIPYLPNLSSGSPVRAYYILKGLAEKNEVYLFAAVNPKEDTNWELLKNLGLSGTYTFELPELKLKDRIKYYLQNKVPYIEMLKKSDFNKVVQKIPNDTDFTILTELKSYSIVEKFFNLLPGKKILDAHNVDYLRIKSEFDSSNVIRRLLGIPVYHKLKNYEVNAAKKMDYILTCSETDKSIYSQYKNESAIAVIPNGVYLHEYQNYKNNPDSHTVLFIGLLSYLPNAVGLKWYIKKVHPKVKQQYPDYKLIITGKGAPNWLQKLSQDDTSIILKGFVKDIKEELAHATVCICPLFSGSGTRLKILEYMAAGKPVVSTYKGAEGLQVCDGENIILTDETTRFADYITTLFSNNKLMLKIGTKAREVIEADYDWKVISEKLIKLLHSINNK